MKIALGADHAGYELKQWIHERLATEGHKVADLGTHDTSSIDYPDYAELVANCLVAGQSEIGILICGTGIGMAIAANKIAGIRAANCNEPFLAEMARRHNNANILTLGSRVIAGAYAETIIQRFLETPYEKGRHQLRLDKITSLEA